MIVVLLPGLDGTGEQFKSLLPQINARCLVLALPQDGAQDYDALTDYVLAQLPNEEFVLLAESFSGPIATRVAQAHPVFLKGLVLVATFLSPPAKMLLNTASLLPLGALSRAPLSSVVIKYLLLGWEHTNDAVVAFRAVLCGVPETLIGQRIEAIKELNMNSFNSDIPVLYILPLQDRLIANSKWREFREIFSDFSLFEINGPHFILQTKTEECAVAINSFVNKQLVPD